MTIDCLKFALRNTSFGCVLNGILNGSALNFSWVFNSISNNFTLNNNKVIVLFVSDFNQIGSFNLILLSSSPQIKISQSINSMTSRKNKILTKIF